MNGNQCIVCKQPATFKTDRGSVCSKHVELAELLDLHPAPAQDNGIHWYNLLTRREWRYQIQERDD